MRRNGGSNALYYNASLDLELVYAPSTVGDEFVLVPDQGHLHHSSAYSTRYSTHAFDASGSDVSQRGERASPRVLASDQRLGAFYGIGSSWAATARAIDALRSARLSPSRP